MKFNGQKYDYIDTTITPPKIFIGYIYSNSTIFLSISVLPFERIMMKRALNTGFIFHLLAFIMVKWL